MDNANVGAAIPLEHEGDRFVAVGFVNAHAIHPEVAASILGCNKHTEPVEFLKAFLLLHLGVGEVRRIVECQLLVVSLPTVRQDRILAKELYLFLHFIGGYRHLRVFCPDEFTNFLEDSPNRNLREPHIHPWTGGVVGVQLVMKSRYEGVFTVGWRIIHHGGIYIRVKGLGGVVMSFVLGQIEVGVVRKDLCDLAASQGHLNPLPEGGRDVFFELCSTHVLAPLGIEEVERAFLDVLIDVPVIPNDPL